MRFYPLDGDLQCVQLSLSSYLFPSYEERQGEFDAFLLQLDDSIPDEEAHLLEALIDDLCVVEKNSDHLNELSCSVFCNTKPADRGAGEPTARLCRNWSANGETARTQSDSGER